MSVEINPSLVIPALIEAVQGVTAALNDLSVKQAALEARFNEFDSCNYTVRADWVRFEYEQVAVAKAVRDITSRIEHLETENTTRATEVDHLADYISKRLP